MPDIYLYEDTPVLRNKLEIRNGETLDRVEAEQSRLNMMLLYEQGFDNFSAAGLCEIHRFLFGDIYEWAGVFRIINIEKRERILGGRSVWYSNDDDIDRDLNTIFDNIQEHDWMHFPREQFVRELVRQFSSIWQVHPFREGNTRTVVMMLTFFVEHFGYYMDQELMTASAGYVRDSFVMASLDQNSEFQHLELILMDAVCTEQINYDENDLVETVGHKSLPEKYQKFQTEKYTPEPHYKREDR